MARSSCGKELDTLPILDGCPSPSEYFLVVGAVGGYGPGLYGLRSWANMLACLLQGGIFGVYGDEMACDDDPCNEYRNSEYAGIELVVFYNGINRYLLPDTEYEMLLTGGFKVLIADSFTHEDYFVVFPNGPTD